MAAPARKANGTAIRKARDAFRVDEEQARALKLPVGKRVTQEEVAELVEWKFKRGGFSAKTVGRAEQSQRVEIDSLFMIGETLAMRFDDTWVPDSEDAVQDLIEQMRRCDRQRSYAKAEEIGTHLLQRADLTGDAYGEVCVETAVVLEHDKRWEEGMALLERGLECGSLGERMTRWAQFQLCILRREYAMDLMARRQRTTTAAIDRLLTDAARDLEDLINTGGNGIRVAARHQLGVLAQLEGRHTEALQLFQECLTARAAAPARSHAGMPFRKGYEHRRIAQCHAHAGHLGLACEHFREALALARDTDHKRLEREVLRDIAAWDIAF